MIPAPESKYDDIINELNEIADRYDPDAFVFKLNRYRNEAKKLISSDPEHGYIILGIIACIENNVELMHRYHKNAIQCSGESVHSLFQYSSSLVAYDMLAEAYQYVRKAYEKAPDEKMILDKLMNLAYALSMDKEYGEYKAMMEKLGFGFQDPDQFLEDHDGFLRGAIKAVDFLLDKHPELIVEPDPEFIGIVNELVDGVDIS